MRGINTILITGKIFSDSIPIGADTEPVSIMTRIFIISTIVARVAVGIKASVAFVLPEPLVLALVNPQPLVRGNTPEPLDLANTPQPLLLGNLPEPLVMGNIPKPLVMAARNLKKPDMMRKKSSKGN
jgi:hypothetical protein